MISRQGPEKPELKIGPENLAKPIIYQSTVIAASAIQTFSGLGGLCAFA